MMAPLEDAIFERIAHLVEAESGLVFSSSRIGEVEAGSRRAMKRAGTADPRAYLAQLQQSSAVREDLIGELTVGESYFFRDPKHFDFVSEQVVPELLSKRAKHAPIRFW